MTALHNLYDFNYIALDTYFNENAFIIHLLVNLILTLRLPINSNCKEAE